MNGSIQKKGMSAMKSIFKFRPLVVDIICVISLIVVLWEPLMHIYNTDKSLFSFIAIIVLVSGLSLVILQGVVSALGGRFLSRGEYYARPKGINHQDRPSAR